MADNVVWGMIAVYVVLVGVQGYLLHRGIKMVDSFVRKLAAQGYFAP